MKISLVSKNKNKYKWRQWFAWYPVVTEEYELIWLEKLWVRAVRTNEYDFWEYSLREPHPDLN